MLHIHMHSTFNVFLIVTDTCTDCVGVAVRMEELSISGSAESNPEHHHWIRTASWVAALRLPGLSGTVPGMADVI